MASTFSKELALKPILMNDFQSQWNIVRENVLAAVERVGQSGWLILGNEVNQFEKQLAEYCGVKYTIGCASGLDALEISLRCLGLKPGEKVLTTPLSAFATTLAIIRAGGTPVFVDVDENGLIDLPLCRKILQEMPELRFFMPVHLYGHAISLEKLSELKEEFNLRIIEDCAQAIGAQSANKYVGQVGDVAATSFYPTKNLGCMGDGGAILTQNETIYNHAKSLRDYGQTAKYEHAYLGLNSRLDELQAAILNSALLPKIKEFTSQRKMIADRYLTNIKNDLIKIPQPPHNSDSIWHLFPVLIKQNREEFQHYLKSLHIQTSIHYPKIIPEQAALKEGSGKFVTATELKQAQYFADHEVSLPIHPYLSDDEVERVVIACNAWRN